MRNLSLTLRRSLFAFLPVVLAVPSLAQDDAPRTLIVDRLGTGQFTTLSAAAKAVRPGDTIMVRPNTGPYREILAIKVSGTAEKPVIFDGGGNVFTGFDPLTTWEEKDGVTSCKLPAFPCVITYKGERLLQDATTGQFTKYADLNEAKDTLTLRPGVEKAGWEYSKRALAVSVNNVSHQIYRNVRASGSTNDGFNLHGTGEDLRFENIEGFHNLDEGFSSHDSIRINIKGGKFWGNDNGIANSFSDKTTVSNTISNVDCYNNLGFGLVLHDCMAVLREVRIWNNGMKQLNLREANIDSEDVRVYTPKWTKRQWLSYTESKTSAGVSAYNVERTTFTGTPPKVETTDAPMADS